MFRSRLSSSISVSSQSGYINLNPFGDLEANGKDSHNIGSSLESRNAAATSSGANQSKKPLCLCVRDSKLNRLLALRGEGMHSQGLSFRGSVTQRPDFERLDSLPPPNYADSRRAHKEKRLSAAQTKGILIYSKLEQNVKNSIENATS